MKCHAIDSTDSHCKQGTQLTRFLMCSLIFLVWGKRICESWGRKLYLYSSKEERRWENTLFMTSICKYHTPCNIRIMCTCVFYSLMGHIIFRHREGTFSSSISSQHVQHNAQQCVIKVPNEINWILECFLRKCIDTSRTSGKRLSNRQKGESFKSFKELRKTLKFCQWAAEINLYVPRCYLPDNQKRLPKNRVNCQICDWVFFF